VVRSFEQLQRIVDGKETLPPIHLTALLSHSKKDRTSLNATVESDQRHTEQKEKLELGKIEERRPLSFSTNFHRLLLFLHWTTK
jgi:hypothetical protein